MSCKTMIKVSVIVPVYNMGNYILECLNSILKQSLDNIEIICIDDGSEDNTFQIINEYSMRHNNMKAYRQNHQYAGVARNFGIQKAKGQYVTFVDADDKFETNDALEILYNNAEKHSAMICVGNMHNDFDEGNIQNLYKDVIFTRNGFVTYGISDLDERPLTLHISALFNRNFLLNNNITFSTGKSSEDVCFCLKAYLLAGKYYAVNADVYHRRVVDKLYDSKEDYQSELCCWTDILLFMSKKFMHNRMIYKYVIKRINVYIDYIYKNYTKENKGILQKVNSICSKNKILMSSLEKEENIHMNILLEEEEIQKHMLNIQSNYRVMWNKIEKSKRIWLYGAGLVGRSVAKYLLKEKVCKIEGFIVSKGGGYFDDLLRIHVYDINDMKIDYHNDLVLITAQDKSAREIEQTLIESNIGNYHVVKYSEFLTYDK